MLFATAPRGPGLTPDGMSYLAAAQSLVHHGTLREPFAAWSAADSTSPLADYPAGFSLAIAAPVALGAPVVQGARWVEALCVGATVGVATWFLSTLVGTSAAVCGALLLLLMPGVTDVSLLVLSEPLFFVVVVATAVVMVRRPDQSLLLGLLTGFGNLVRYAGVFLVAGAVIWSLLRPQSGSSWRRRLGKAGLVVLPGALLHLYWRWSGIDPGGGLSSSAYGGVGDALREGWRTGVAWLAPGIHGAAATLMVLILLGLFAALGVIAYWREPDFRPLAYVLGILVVLYVGTVGFARLYVIPDVPFDSRILAPLFLLLTLGGAAALRSQPPKFALVAVAGWCILALIRNGSVIRDARAHGLDYETEAWQQSPVAAWLRGPGMARTLYTTDPAAIWFITGRPSRLLPDTLDADSVRAFQARFAATPSALLDFDVPFSVMAPADSVVAALALTPVARFDHGTVWVKDTVAKSPRR